MTLQVKMNLKGILKTEVDRRLLEAKMRISRNLSNNTPIDTGRARDGWHVTENGVENDVEYISDLNNGSSRKATKNFIEQTIINDKEVRVVGTIVQQK